jgi:methylglutaconyl-CoA hydratase
VLTNQGRVFCAGADLKEQSSRKASSPAAALAEVFGRIVRSPKPFVGRIAGHAVAGGMGLAAALDISVALEDARFGFTEVRVGVAPAIISTICLPKMRKAEAADAFLRGNRFTGTEAARLGLINEAVAADQLDARVDAIVDDLLAGGPNALAATKQLLSRVPTMGFEAALEWTADLSAGLFASPEAAEGMTAYLQKRPPPWAPPDDS